MKLPNQAHVFPLEKEKIVGEYKLNQIKNPFNNQGFLTKKNASNKNNIFQKKKKTQMILL